MSERALKIERIERKLIVVVDDDDAFRELVATVLQRAGYHVVAVATGEEAFEAMQLEQPALVLLDVRLAGMSGYDVCRVIRANLGEALPIIFISGERMEAFDRVAGIRLGADDYLVKPIDPDELLARVDRLVGRIHALEAYAPAVSNLTPRETEILELLIDGLRPKEIAQQLSISRKTVSVHVQNILSKFGVHSQTQAVAAALSSGLFSRRPEGRSAGVPRIPWGGATRTARMPPPPRSGLPRR